MCINTLAICCWCLTSDWASCSWCLASHWASDWVSCSWCVALDWASDCVSCSSCLASDWASCSLTSTKEVSNSEILWIISLDDGGVNINRERFAPFLPNGVGPKPTPRTHPELFEPITQAYTSFLNHRIPPWSSPCNAMPSSLKNSLILACFPTKTK